MRVKHNKAWASSPTQIEQNTFLWMLLIYIYIQIANNTFEWKKLGFVPLSTLDKRIRNVAHIFVSLMHLWKLGCVS